MEVRYNKNGKADFVAISVEGQKQRIASKYGEISVRVVDWNAVERKKAQAANSVSQTEDEPETSTAVIAVEDYSTALVPEVVRTFDGSSGVGAVTEHNNALVKACETPQELFELLKTADNLTLNRLVWATAGFRVLSGAFRMTAQRLMNWSMFVTSWSSSSRNLKSAVLTPLP